MWVSKNDAPIGGRGHIVQIDESKIGHQKYHKGRIITGQWVFGGIDTTTNECFIEPVESRNAEVLTEVITRRIAPGSIIVSDCWRAYTCLENKGWKYHTVNHRYNFVDPVSKAHTQNIERLWRDMRGAIPKYGLRKKNYNGYLGEFLFKRYFHYTERLEAFFEVIAEMYPLSIDDELHIE